MKAKISLGKRAIGGLCGLIALAAGCVSAPKLVEQPKAQPKGSIFIEETITNNNSYHFANLSTDGKPYARVLVTDGKDKDKVEFATRGDVNLGSFTGNAEIIGFTDSYNNQGIGLNTRGKIGNTKLGMALEKKIENDEATNLFMAYTNRNFGNLGLTGGISEINGNTTIISSVDYVLGQNFFGIGFNVNESGEGFGTAVIGKFPKIKKQGFGYYGWTKVDSSSNYLINFVASTKSTIPVFTKALVSPEAGILDPRILENWFDPHPYLWEKTSPGGVVGNIKYSEFGEVRTASIDIQLIYCINFQKEKEFLQELELDIVKAVMNQ